MIFRKRNKHYISPIDLFLEQFKKVHAPSRSQRDQIKKYQRVFKLRDHADGSNARDKVIWREF